jgi:CHAT domain-containing protein/tetratricopeptide (TPR) repeat protein
VKIDKEFHRVLLSKTFNISRHSLIYLFSIILLSKSVIATPNEFELQIAQQSISTEKKLIHSAAKKAFNEGQVLDRQGTKESRHQAIVKYQAALNLWQQLENKAEQANILNKIGSAYASLGDFDNALTSFNQELSLRDPVKDRVAIVVALSNTGKIYSSIGEQEKALTFYKRALSHQDAILKQALSLQDAALGKRQKGTILNNIGAAHSKLEEWDNALNYFRQALHLRGSSGTQGEVLVTLNNIIYVYYCQGDGKQVLNYFNQALLIQNEVGDRDKHTESVILSNVGSVYADLKDWKQALNYLNQSLQINREIGDERGEAVTLHNIGTVYEGLKKWEQALNYFNQSLSLKSRVGDRPLEARTLFHIAKVDRNQHNFSSALANIRSAIEIVENLRTRIVSPELRTSYFATQQNIYQFKTNLLMELHKQNPLAGYDGQALETTDRAHARTLVELLTESKIDIREGIKPELLKREQDFKQNYNALEIQRIDLTSQRRTEPELVNFYQKRANLLQDYRQLQTDIRQYNPRYAALKFPEPLTLKQIQQQVLDNDTILLAYSLGTESSYLWLVSKTKIESYELPKQAEIEKQAKYFYNEQERDPERPVHLDKNNLIGVQLSNILLQPIANKLGNKRLLIVGDGVLQYLSFAALPLCKDVACNNSKLLVTEHEIVNAPSISTIATLRTEKRDRTPTKILAAIADPVFNNQDDRCKNLCRQAELLPKVQAKTQVDNLDNRALQRATREPGISKDRLKYSGEEAQNILSLVDPKDRIEKLGFDANREFVMSPELGKYRNILFATHGILDDITPELSGLRLSSIDHTGQPINGFLKLNDIFNLKLSADLVVLSACQTGLGKDVKGEGLLGLTRGFMYAGSPRVVVSLWKVQDDATAVLMTKFYTNMLKYKLKSAEALRKAQLEMSQSGSKYTDPYYWAGFILQGEWQ